VADHQTSVLVVGGGLVGLTAALLLQHHGLDSVLVERRSGPSVLPRSRGVHQRTVEIFRQIGIEQRVQDAAATALKAGAFGGAWTGSSLLSATPLDLGHLVHTGADADLSPSRFCFCPQVVLEPVLAEIARERGSDVRFGVELTELVSSGTGVRATLRGSAGTSTLYAEYVIAADGAASPIRSMLGIPSWTLPPTHHYLNLFVRADLSGLLGGRTFSQCEIVGDAVRGVVTAHNNTDEWTFHIEYDPTHETVADYPESRCVGLVRAAIGRSDVAVRVVGRSAWDTGVAVAEDYRRGRVFLAGDAAHRHAPWGGFGANTGIADVHNLVWKLAAVQDGWAGGALLDTYRAERRPRAVTAGVQARLRTDFHARYGLRTGDSAAEVDALLDTSAVMTRFRYGADEPVTALAGQIGTRLPHTWVGEGRSTLDLLDRGFLLLAGPDAPDWESAAAQAARATAVPLAVHRIDRREWTDQNALSDGGAVLVRPDQHVVGRTDAGLSRTALADLLRAATGRSRPAAVSRDREHAAS
jgi:putative polyketide hydroxylase